MKKTFLFFFAFVLIFAISVTVCFAATEESIDTENDDSEGYFILGDVNGDGEVTNSDVLMIFRYIYSPEQYPLPKLCYHDFSEWGVEREPDCANEGLMTRSCIKCGTVEGKAIDATDIHTEVIYEAVAPTCTETGLTEGSHCDVCGKIFVAQTAIDALGHTEVVDKAVEPSCTETGLTEGKHCSVCDEVLVTQTEINMIDHNFVDGNCQYCGANAEVLKLKEDI